MALYSASLTNWANFTLNGVAGRATAYQILQSAYPTNVFVPNLGYDLKIIPTQSAIELYAPSNLTTPILTLAANATFEINSSKNSVNANDYILGGSGTSDDVTVLFEVG